VAHDKNIVDALDSTAETVSDAYQVL
jgi:hypothetical protein